MARRKYKFNVNRLAYTLTRYPVSFLSGKRIDTTSRSYALTLNDVSLTVARFPFIIGNTLNYNLTLVDAGLTVHKQFPVATTDFTLSLQNVNLQVARTPFIIVNTLNYNLSLVNSDLIYTPQAVTTLEVDTTDFELEIFEPDYILVEALLPGPPAIQSNAFNSQNSLLNIGMITRR